MGRAATALGAPESNSGILDGSVTGTHLVNTESGRSPSFGVDRVSQTLSQPEASEPTSQQHSHEAEQEVAQRQLWFSAFSGGASAIRKLLFAHASEMSQ